VRAITAAELASAPEHSLYRLGHSTLLVKLRGGWWLTDPVFSKRASPVQWMGPKRFHAPPIALHDLPPIRGVLLSHDHYDHLDRATIKYLASRADVFLTPLGVGDRLIAWGVPRDRVRQLDWWQETEVDGVRFAATPAQLFRAHTDPKLFARWVGPDGMTTTVDRWDATTGGSWRYVAARDGMEFGFRGCFHEVRPDRIVQTFTWEGEPDGVALETLTFEDLGDGRTRLHAQSLCDSFEGRDAWLRSGMEVGVDQGYAKLDALLASGQTIEGQTIEGQTFEGQTDATAEGAKA
jgi:uncharacterized protein YndB with AHSA1/START domain